MDLQQHMPVTAGVRLTKALSGKCPDQAESVEEARASAPTLAADRNSSMVGLSPLHFRLVPAGPDGHACLGHRKLPRLAMWLG